MNKPNMRWEIIDALKDYYKDDIEILVDCLISLGEDDEVYKLGYCPNCGSELMEMNYREYHPEVDAYEYFTHLVCPCCDCFN